MSSVFFIYILHISWWVFYSPSALRTDIWTVKLHLSNLRLSLTQCNGGTSCLMLFNDAMSAVRDCAELLCSLTEAEGYSTLQEGGVRLISQETCRKPEVYGNHVTADMLCAGLNGCVDACQVGNEMQWMNSTLTNDLMFFLSEVRRSWTTEVRQMCK